MKCCKGIKGNDCVVTTAPQPLENFSKNGKYRRNMCKACTRPQINDWYADNKDRHLANTKKWASENKDKRKVIGSKYRENNREKCRKAARSWQKQNPATVTAIVAKRRSAKLNATPSWANLEQIKRIYAACAKITEQTGIKHHVDHIIPLQGENVCGLHVESNLAIIPAKMNLQKSNKY